MLKVISIACAAAALVAAVTAGIALANGSGASPGAGGSGLVLAQASGDDALCRAPYLKWRSTGSAKWRQRYHDCRGW